MQRAVLRIEEVFADLPSLETERLLLRKMRMADAQDLFEYASDPDVARYTTWPLHSSLDDSKAYLRRVLDLYAAHEVAEWGLEHKAGGKFIGTCGYVDWSPYHARAEVGYAMSRNYWGQGLMTEAVRAVFRFGFQRMMLNRVEARCMIENVASARVMEKCGMRYEGILREHMYAKGRYDDLKIYSILRREWTG
jgi:ribosomal-protein-alanine N-acetyltransferase